MTVEPVLSERLLDMQHRRVNRWSHVDQCTVGNAIWALRSLEAITDVWMNQPGQGFRTYVLEGWPELARVLDALIEED